MSDLPFTGTKLTLNEELRESLLLVFGRDSYTLTSLLTVLTKQRGFILGMIK